jgi:protein-disulfide isomerase
MRRAWFFALLAVFFALPARAAETTKDRLSKYFGGWYSVCPGTSVTVSELREIAIAGYDAYRVERRCDLKNRNEMSIALVNRSADEVFVGEVLHSDERKDQPFSAARDVPLIEAALKDAYGVPVSLQVEPAGVASGSSDRANGLLPIRVLLRQAPDATAAVSGFVSADGASLLLGSFHPLGEDPAVLRERALAPSPAGREPKGSFVVTAFMDFQCDRCRQRMPKVRDFVRARGGVLDVRFLPLVKIHNWAFTAAESAAALANFSPALSAAYEEALAPRAAGLTEAGARQIGSDVAEAAGVREAYEAELSSGRARDRVVRDIELALSLGLNSTPIFFFRGAQLTGEPGLAENAIQSGLGNAAEASRPGSARP